jgi:hypothetical protein
MRLRCNALLTKAPSTTGLPAEFRKLQSGETPIIFFNRPPDAASSTPLTLLHPIFGQFVHDCEALKPTAEDNAFVLELSLEMSHFYSDEERRATAFRSILARYGIDLTPGGIGKFTTDGDLRKEGRCYFILEVKPELGSGGCDPLLQAVAYYVASMKQLSESPAHPRLPGFLLYLIGMFIEIFIVAPSRYMAFLKVHILVLLAQFIPTDRDYRFFVLFSLYVGM